MIQIPQRFELVYGLAAWDSGIRLIPFTICMPFGAAISGVITNRLHVAAIWIVVGSACLQTLGFALLGTIPNTLEIPSRIYGFEIIAGASCGCNYTLLFLVVPRALELRDHGTDPSNSDSFLIKFRQLTGHSGWDGGSKSIQTNGRIHWYRNCNRCFQQLRYIAVIQSDGHIGLDRRGRSRSIPGKIAGVNPE